MRHDSAILSFTTPTGTARQKYNDWYNGDGYVEDVLVNTNARLVWIGQKKNERVLLYRYVHGKLFLGIPRSPMTMDP